MRLSLHLSKYHIVGNHMSRLKHDWLVSSGHSVVEGLCYLDSRYQMGLVSDFLRWVGAWGLFAAGPSLAKLGVSSSSDCL